MSLINELTRPCNVVLLDNRKVDFTVQVGENWRLMA
jgi:hypothetical protein